EGGDDSAHSHQSRDRVALSDTDVRATLSPMMAPCVSGQLLRAGIVTTVPVCRRRALAPCDGAPTTRPSGNSSEPPPERQLLLARLPTQLEEAGHATAGPRRSAASRLLEEPVYGRQLRRVHRALGERDRLGREGRDPVGEPLDERAELARPEGMVQVAPAFGQIRGGALARSAQVRKRGSFGSRCACASTRGGVATPRLAGHGEDGSNYLARSVKVGEEESCR